MLKGQSIDAEFHVAYKNNDLEKIKQILLHTNYTIPADLINNLFFRACAELQLEMVELLLKDERIDINKVDEKTGKSPLRAVCYRNRPEILWLLLKDLRLDIDQKDKLGWTALTNAFYTEASPIIYLLMVEKIAREPRLETMDLEAFIKDAISSLETDCYPWSEVAPDVINAIKAAQNSPSVISKRREEISAQKTDKKLSSFFVLYTNAHFKHNKQKVLDAQKDALEPWIKWERELMKTKAKL